MLRACAWAGRRLLDALIAGNCAQASSTRCVRTGRFRVKVFDMDSFLPLTMVPSPMRRMKSGAVGHLGSIEECLVSLSDRAFPHPPSADSLALWSSVSSVFHISSGGEHPPTMSKGVAGCARTLTMVCVTHVTWGGIFGPVLDSRPRGSGEITWPGNSLSFSLRILRFGPTPPLLPNFKVRHHERRAPLPLDVKRCLP